MTTTHFDENYLEWLYGLIAPDNAQSTFRRSYWSLTKQLYAKPYRWSVRNDDNREADGKQLRADYLEQTGLHADDIWLHADCSFLEMLVALAYRTAFQSYGDGDEWFWLFLQNLALIRYTDDVFDEAVYEDVDRVMDDVIFRRYGEDGTGGLFPLRYPEHDQRRIEIWYQMAAYILENTDIATGP